MSEELNNAFTEILTSSAKKGYAKDISLKEYLNSFTLKELKSKLLTYFITSDNIHKFITLKNKNKLVDYIMENLDNIIEIEVSSLHVNAFDGLKRMIKDNHMNIYTIMSVCNNTIIAELVKKGEDDVDYFIQKDILKIVNKYLNNKVRNTVVKQSEIVDIVSSLTNLYGVLTEEEIEQYFNKYKVKYDGDLYDYLFLGMTMDLGFEVHEEDDSTFVFGPDFENKSDAIEYYYTYYQEMCMDYSPKVLKDFQEGRFIKSLPEYKKIWRYLNERFEISPSEKEDIDLFVIEDFISQANISIEEAIVNTRKKLKKEFEASLEEINQIIDILKEMFNKVPKMSKRGRI